MCKALIILFSSPPVTKDSQQFKGTESSLQEVMQDSSKGWVQPQRSLRGCWVLCQDHVMVQFSFLLNLLFSPFPLYVLIPCVLPKYTSCLIWVRTLCLCPISYGNKGKQWLVIFLLLRQVHLCLYFADRLVTHFPCLKFTDGTIHFSTSFSCIGVSTWRQIIDLFSYTLKKKKKRMACSFSFHCVRWFNFSVPVLMKQTHNIWRWSSNLGNLK